MDPPTRPSGRKRVISDSEEPSARKKSRLDPPSLPPPTRRAPSLSRSPSITFDYDRFTMPLLSSGERPYSTNGRPLSSSSSVTAPGTPVLMRSASFSSFHSQATTPEASHQPYYPEGSSKYSLRDSRVAIDFSLPSAAEASVPLSYSAQNVLYFSRGNRIQFRSMIAADSVSQLCKLQETHGDLKLLEAGGTDRAGVLAVATTKGVVQVWDTDAKKMVSSWTTKGVASMAWNGPTLSIGGLKGTIRHYDTRIQPISKMKEQAAKVTRHQASIATLSWNVDGKFLASGDESGIVYCWDARSKVPLDVGEFIQRRKKIQHGSAISALAWCPWQAKLLATGDTKGTIKLWMVDAANPHSNATAPSKLELGSKIVNLHFSPNYKELLSTLGPLPAAPMDTGSWPRGILSNSVAVHAIPSLRPIASVAVSEQVVCGSVLNTGAAVHKVVVAVPGESKLKLFEVWGKRKEIRRQGSFLGNTIR